MKSEFDDEDVVSLSDADENDVKLLMSEDHKSFFEVAELVNYFHMQKQ